MLCYWYDAPSYFFFGPDIPELLYYSHFPAMVLAVIVGLFLFFHNPKALLNRIFLLIALTFATITVINLVTWTNNDSRIIAFAWSLLGALQAIISILLIYFIAVFLHKQDVSQRVKGVFFILLLPAILFGASNANLSGFDIAWCDAFQYEGEWYSLYYNFLGVVAMGWIGYMLVRAYATANESFRHQIVCMGIGVLGFLLTFFTIFYLADYLATIKFVEDSRLELYGFFGMGIFVLMMSILIVRFKSFNVGAHAAEALVIALVALVASQFTYANSTTTTVVLTAVTLTLTCIAGYYLIRSVRREIEQRQRNEELAKKLAKANKRLRELDKMKSEFVSIASHQLRSPLTSIRGYASMLLDGSFGKVPQKAKAAIERIADSSATMATSVEDYLNVSRIEAGNMKYELVDFNLKDEAAKIADDKRREAIRKGLLLTFKSKVKNHGIVNADLGKTRQILHNLINNAIKYTPKGSIEVRVEEDTARKQLHVHITDTGVGLAPDEIDGVFGKFERAKGAAGVNATGTGLGLFIARKMANDMQGEISVSSPGPHHGSTFTLTLPLQM